jgi:hypothetical protein
MVKKRRVIDFLGKIMNEAGKGETFLDLELELTRLKEEMDKGKGKAKKCFTFKDLIFKLTDNGSFERAEMYFKNGFGVMVGKSKYYFKNPKKPYERLLVTPRGKYLFYTDGQSERDITRFMKKTQKIKKGVFDA